MKNNWKLLVLIAFILIIFMSAGGWLGKIFAVDPLKKEIKESNKALKESRDSIVDLLRTNSTEIKKVETNEKKINEKYEESHDTDYSVNQLDSLRAEYKRKTGY